MDVHHVTANGARLDAKAIEELRQRPIPPVEKGFALLSTGGDVSAATLAARHAPALGGPFTMPLLVLHDSALRQNAESMAAWCASAGVLLAPHGKTTMAPQLVARQFAAGAWAVTVATLGQARVYRAFGASRILIANELTDPAGITWLAGELAADQGWECFAYADSVAGVRLLDEALSAAGGSRPLSILVELGFPGGRTGCRSVADALAVAAAVEQAPTLALAGCSGYEGGIGQDARQETLDAVADYCRRLAELASALGGSLVSAGGSAYFDVVARELTAGVRPADGTSPAIVLRSGCYLTHDHGEYAAIGPGIRSAGPALVPALELWAPVLSCPEAGLALACAGRRDVAFDQGMPIPQRIRRPDGTIEPATELTVTRLDDQHAYVRVPPGAVLAPGDLIGFGISHPCTTFDKWRVIPVVDDSYAVIDAIHTFF